MEKYTALPAVLVILGHRARQAASLGCGRTLDAGAAYSGEVCSQRTGPDSHLAATHGVRQLPVGLSDERKQPIGLLSHCRLDHRQRPKKVKQTIASVTSACAWRPQPGCSNRQAIGSTLKGGTLRGAESGGLEKCFKWFRKTCRSHAFQTAAGRPGAVHGITCRAGSSATSSTPGVRPQAKRHAISALSGCIRSANFLYALRTCPCVRDHIKTKRQTVVTA